MSLVSLTAPQVAIIQAAIEDVADRAELSDLRGRRLFITGGTGFFGTWLLSLLQHLNARGWSVQATVLSRDPSAFLARCPQFGEQSWLDFVAGDVRDFEVPDRHFDMMLHGATETSMTAHQKPARMLDDIILGTRRALELAERCGVRRVLLISSGAVYGPQSPQLLHQPDTSYLACDPMRAASAYGEGKRVMELMGAIAQHEHGIESVSARCFSFCGPMLPINGHFAIGNFVRDALFGEEITVQGDGSPVRSYLFGADLAIWLLVLLTKGQAGLSYNVGSDEPITILELAERVRSTLAPGKPVRVVNGSSGEAFNRNIYVPEITRARGLSCAPWTPLEKALMSMGAFLGDHR